MQAAPYCGSLGLITRDINAAQLRKITPQRERKKGRESRKSNKKGKKEQATKLNSSYPRSQCVMQILKIKLHERILMGMAK